MLDTDICSYLISGLASDTLQDMVKKHHNALCVATITYAKLSYDAAKKDSERLKEAVALFLQLVGEIVPWSKDAAIHYSEIRCALEAKGTPIGNMDLMIAASALAENAVLITNNTKHFSMVPNLKIQNWQKLPS